MLKYIDVSQDAFLKINQLFF